MILKLTWLDDDGQSIGYTELPAEMLATARQIVIPKDAHTLQTEQNEHETAVQTEMWHFAVHVPVGQAGRIRQAIEELDGTEVYRARREGT